MSKRRTTVTHRHYYDKSSSTAIALSLMLSLALLFGGFALVYAAATNTLPPSFPILSGVPLTTNQMSSSPSQLPTNIQWGAASTSWTIVNTTGKNAPLSFQASAQTPQVLGASSTTQMLFVQGFNFQVPNTATVTSVQATVTRGSLLGVPAGTNLNTNGCVTDSGAMLIYGGVQIGSNNAAAGFWPAIPAGSTTWTTGTITYSGTPISWNLNGTLTPSLVDSPNFGFGLAATLTNNGNLLTCYAFINSVTMTVYFNYPNPTLTITTGLPTTVSAGPINGGLNQATATVTVTGTLGGQLTSYTITLAAITLTTQTTTVQPTISVYVATTLTTTFIQGNSNNNYFGGKNSLSNGVSYSNFIYIIIGLIIAVMGLVGIFLTWKQGRI